MKKLKTVKEVFLYIAGVYEKCDSYKQVWDNGCDELICIFIDDLHNDDLISESLYSKALQVLRANKPKEGDSSEYWYGDGFWWDTHQASLDGKESELLNTKAKLLRKIAKTL